MDMGSITPQINFAGNILVGCQVKIVNIIVDGRVIPVKTVRDIQGCVYIIDGKFGLIYNASLLDENGEIVIPNLQVIRKIEVKQSLVPCFI